MQCVAPSAPARHCNSRGGGRARHTLQSRKPCRKLAMARTMHARTSPPIAFQSCILSPVALFLRTSRRQAATSSSQMLPHTQRESGPLGLCPSQESRGEANVAFEAHYLSHSWIYTVSMCHVIQTKSSSHTNTHLSLVECVYICNPGAHYIQCSLPKSVVSQPKQCVSKRTSSTQTSYDARHRTHI